MTVAIADRTQTMAALALANTIRFRQSDLRRQLRALSYREGLAQAAELLEEAHGTDDRSEAVARMRLEYLLLSVTRFGRKRAERLVESAGGTHLLKRRIANGDRIETLTLRQRSIIACELRRIAEGQAAA